MQQAKLTAAINQADQILIAAGNGFWQAEQGLTSQKTAQAIAAGKTPAAKWAAIRKLIKQADSHPSQDLPALLATIGTKPYFAATTIWSHLFEQAGFARDRIFHLQGDWTKLQCSSGINHGLTDLDLNSEEIPVCQQCGRPLQLAVAANPNFFPDSQANARFRWFLVSSEKQRLLVLSLGVDQSTPQLQAPLQSLLEQFPQWQYLKLL